MPTSRKRKIDKRASKTKRYAKNVEKRRLRAIYEDMIMRQKKIDMATYPKDVVDILF